MAEMVNLLLCMVVVGGLVAQSCPSLEIPWTVAHQAPLSMGFSRREYWSDLPFPSPGDLPDPGIKPRSPALHADYLLIELPEKPLITPGGGLVSKYVLLRAGDGQGGLACCDSWGRKESDTTERLI